MNDTSDIIKIRNLTTRFGTSVIHDRLDLDIKQNEILGLVGGSGSGKSVLVHSILGLNEVASGQILFCDPDNGARDITKMPHAALLKLQRQWGVMFQHGALFSALTISENIQFPILEHINISKALAEELAAVKIRLVGLSLDAAVKYPSELSGGMIKRAALARALALDPKILFLDEPTSGLDPIAAGEFDSLICHLQRTLGLTVVIITHDIDSLVTVSDRVAVLVDKGVVVDTVKGLSENPHAWIQAYFNGPRARIRLDRMSAQD